LFLRFFEHATKRAAAKHYHRVNYPAIRRQSLHKTLFCDSDGEQNMALPLLGDQVPPPHVYSLAAENMFSVGFRKEYLNHPFMSVRASLLAADFKRSAEARKQREWRLKTQLTVTKSLKDFPKAGIPSGSLISTHPPIQENFSTRFPSSRDPIRERSQRPQRLSSTASYSQVRSFRPVTISDDVKIEVELMDMTLNEVNTDHFDFVVNRNEFNSVSVVLPSPPVAQVSMDMNLKMMSQALSH